MSYLCSPITRTSSTLQPPSSSHAAKSIGQSTSLVQLLDLLPCRTVGYQARCVVMKMSTLMERMLMHWLTHITFQSMFKAGQLLHALVLNSASSSSPSNMVSKLTQSLSLTSHAYESALTQPLPSQPQLQQTLGLFHKMVTSFAIRDWSMSLTIRTSNWTSFTPTTTIAWPDTLASPRQSRISIVSSIGPEWSPSSPTTSICAQSAVTESHSITSLWPPSIPPNQ